MKLHGPLLLALAGALACGGGTGVPRPEGPPAYVLAGKGLNLRAEPSRSAAEVKDVPFGTELVLMPDAGPTAEVSGMREPWRKVWHDGVIGWAFGGYIGPFPPPERCDDLGDTVQSLWGVEGAPNLLLQKGDPQNRFEQWSATLRGGATLEWVNDPDGGSDTLVMPGVSLNQAWNTLRRCIPEPEAARGWTAPSSSRSCGNGCSVVVDPTTIVVTHAQDRGCTTRFEKVGGDVRISVGCGLESLAPTAPTR